MATHTSTPVSVAAALARLGGRRARLGSAAALATALEAADLPPEILTAIEVASISPRARMALCDWSLNGHVPWHPNDVEPRRTAAG